MDSSHPGDDTRHDNTPAKGGQGSGTGILDLPLEILFLTFEHFRNDDLYYSMEDLRETCRALRLTCRRLSDVATSMLFSTLAIELDKKALRRAGELVSCNSIIATSVRKVVISLACYNPEEAVDMSLFVESRLQDIHGFCKYYDPDWQLCREAWNEVRRPALHGSESPVLNEGCEDDSHKYPPEVVECLRNGHRIFDAWDGDRYLKYYDQERHFYGHMETERQKAVRTYRELLWKAHEVYHQKHQEQLELIQSSSFVQGIVRFLGRVRHEGLEVIITDDPMLDAKTGTHHHDRVRVINDNKRLLTAMSTPRDWFEVYSGQSGDGDVSMPAVRLLSELPVACHKAGTPITDLKMECFPTWGQLTLLSPEKPKFVEMEILTELSTACQQLEKFQFGFGGESFVPAGRGQPPLSPRDRVYAISYLEAMLSGGKLDTIWVDTNRFGHRGPYSTPEDYYFALGPALEGVNWTKVHTLILHSFAIRQDVLESMFGQLNGSALRTLHFAGVRLRGDGGGSWADALDILRDTLACRGDDLLVPDVSLDDLQGGELDALYSSPRKWHRDLDTLSDLEDEDEEMEYGPWTDEQVSDVANAFVLGYVEENPLR